MYTFVNCAMKVSFEEKNYANLRSYVYLEKDNFPTNSRILFMFVKLYVCLITIEIFEGRMHGFKEKIIIPVNK